MACRAARTFRRAHLLAGSDVRYDVGHDHVLAGRLASELTLDDGRPIAAFLHQGRPAARGCADRVDVVVAAVADLEAGALLLRPDGYIAWAADTFDIEDEHRLRAALQRWFGVSAAKREPMRRGNGPSSVRAEERTA